jgi:type I restriction enzyme, S subunit
LKLATYLLYKPSRVEWLGDVPEHWEMKHLRYVCRFAYGDSLAAEDREEGLIPVFGSNGPVGSHNAANTQKPVIVVGRKGSHGKINFSEQEVFAIDTTYFIDHRYTRADLRWLSYVLATVGLDAVSKDSAVPGLAREDAYAHFLVTPPAEEQLAISDFLDRETAKLDTLVEKKRALIEKLKEKRSALISHTVNDKIVTRYMDDRDFQNLAFPILAREIFEAIREKDENTFHG